MSFKGVDISEHNGSIDFAKLKKSVDFVIMRIGWVGNKNNHTLDKKFKANYEACKKHGIKVGAYVYIYSNSVEHAKEGAEWAVKQIKGKTFDLPIYADMEDKSIKGLGKTTLTAITKAFNDVIEKAGYWAGVYANLDWFKNYLDGASLVKRYTSWIAHYISGTDKYKGSYDMWQNSSTGKVDGISGNVDTNYLYRDLFSAIKGKATTSNASKNESKPDNSKTTYSNGAESFNSNYRNGKTYTVNANGGLRLRKGAGTDKAIITTLPKGSKVTWYGYYTKVGNVIWRYVKTASGKVGFVSSEYLK
jgi:GH25 family lysozyme M1 (1,4-beta-N-acetylmuramidase)